MVSCSPAGNLDTSKWSLPPGWTWVAVISALAPAELVALAGAPEAAGTGVVDAAPVPEPVVAVVPEVTVKPALRLVGGFGARKRSQCAPFVVASGTVTLPE